MFSLIWISFSGESVLKIFVECNVDGEVIKFVLRKIGISESFVEHERGKNRVVKKTINSPRSIGLIDEDPWAIMPKEMKELKEESKDSSLYRILQIAVYYSEKHSRIIMLKPRIEEWLIRLCKLSKIDYTKYGLPSDISILKKVINVKLRAIQKLLEVLFEKSDYFREFISVVNRMVEEIN